MCTVRAALQGESTAGAAVTVSAQGGGQHAQHSTDQFCTVEYLISASLAALSSTTAACSWFSS